MPIEVEIVSPTKKLFSRSVDMAVLPGSEGDIAAMQDHSPVLLMLRGGVVDLYEGGKVTDRFFVESGFAEITPTQCTVLADRALPVSELVATDVEKRAAAAQEAYDKADKNDSNELARLLEEMQISSAEKLAIESR